MPSPFSRTIRSLNAERSRLSTVATLASVVILGGWSLWFVAARVAIYETSEVARLEVDSAVHPIEAAVSGRVIRTNLAIGREVQVGEVLVEMESDAQRLQLIEEEARAAALAAQLAALRGQTTAERRVQSETQAAAPVAINEAKARYDEAAAAVRAASEEYKSLAKLHAEGLVAELSVIKARAEADRLQAAADAAKFAVNRQDKDQRAKQSGQQAVVENLSRDAATLEGEIKMRAAVIERLRHEIELRVVRAPASGKLGETATLQPGQFVREGDKLGAVIPDGKLNAVAEFAPSAAMGRIQAGQRARLRLDGFAWTEYGQVSATVSRVAREPRSGRVRVELAVNPGSAPLIPSQHGLPGKVEIEIERVSPAELATRSVGKMLSQKIDTRGF
ncbi:MAG TPA: HlyD family efflux transporter periplasmic adaptor subunit [Blastocatellia bacterium]|nr:HlyD family efflux transporter periplasmic adaptor subunit [Blastocatellia bacterium]